MSLTINNIVIESRESDKFINATQLCKAGGKKFKDWYRTDATKLLIETLEDDLKQKLEGHPATSKVVDITHGGKHSGSWIHPDLAVQLAQWISPSFAIQVSRWIRELFITGSVSIDSRKSDEELNRLRLEVQRQAEELKEQKENNMRLHVLHNELLTMKKLSSRDETIYICSTLQYAKGAIFKVGRTKNSTKLRSSSHNITHISGDKMKVLKEYKVHDAVLVENRIHKKLKGLMLAGEKEFVMCPFNLLDEAVKRIVENDDLENEMVDHIVDDVINLRMKAFNPEQWLHGLDMNVFKETISITMGDEKEELDVTRWDETRKRNFVAFCIKEYIKEDNRINEDQFNSVEIIWKTFQTFLMNNLPISRKCDFKAMEWRPLVKEEAEKERCVMKWKSS